MVFYDVKRGLWTVSVQDSRDLDNDGARRIMLDARTGRIVANRHWADGTPGDTVLAWQLPLHSGQAFGLLGRVLVLLAGIATCSLVVTGYAMWWRKLRARRAHAGWASSECGGMLQPAE
jgi:uncharacterized iron-regulated membrane protein